jgi:hypothetical protein
VPSAVEVGLNFGLDTLGCTHSQTDWYERCACLLIEMTRIVAPNRTVVLADDTQLGINANLMGRRVVPFLERDGQYNGQPADDATAMTELERLRDAGADYFACAWPSFWWLEHYRGFSAYLRSGFQCLVDNSELKVFDLHGTNKRVRV